MKKWDAWGDMGWRIKARIKRSQDKKRRIKLSGPVKVLTREEIDRLYPSVDSGPKR
jgi:hypothetical protein